MDPYLFHEKHMYRENKYYENYFLMQGKAAKYAQL